MNEVLARITEAIVALNAIASTVSDNDGVEFDVDKRLSVLETAIDDLNSDIEDAVEFSAETGE